MEVYHGTSALNALDVFSIGSIMSPYEKFLHQIRDAPKTEDELKAAARIATLSAYGEREGEIRGFNSYWTSKKREAEIHAKKDSGAGVVFSLSINPADYHHLLEKSNLSGIVLMPNPVDISELVAELVGDYKNTPELRESLERHIESLNRSQ